MASTTPSPPLTSAGIEAMYPLELGQPRVRLDVVEKGPHIDRFQLTNPSLEREGTDHYPNFVVQSGNYVYPFPV